MKSIKDNQITSNTTAEFRQKGLAHAETLHGSNQSHIEALNHMHKITHALYMVTDLLDIQDTLILGLRNTAAMTVNTLNKLLVDNDVKNISLAYHNLSSVLQSFNLVSKYYDVSDMNHAIIDSEIIKLMNHIKTMSVESEKKDSLDLGSFFKNDMKRFDTSVSFGLDASVKQKNLVDEVSQVQDVIEQTSIIYKTEPVSKTQAVIKDISSKPAQTKNIKDKNISPKAQRHANILAILNEKNNASINDICALFKDCSSKTIQRDLAELIKTKKVIKRGDRRWSTYSLK